MTNAHKVLLSCVALHAGALVAAEADLATQATNQLGLELLRAATHDPGAANQLFSPYSIQLALAMTYAGADGETHREMARVLHFSEDEAALQKSFAALRANLADAVRRSENLARWQDNADRPRPLFGQKPVVSEEPKATPTNAMQLAVANRLFGQAGFRYEPVFVRVTQENFAATLQELDFRRDASAARLTINGWVEEQTRKKIVDLIPVGGVGAVTRLVLVNAVYLKAPWAVPFMARLTEEAPFSIGGSEAHAVPMMHKTDWLGYQRTEDFAAVTLPYHGSGLQFLIVLPHAKDGLGALVGRVQPAQLAEFARLPARKVELYLPKFRMQPPTLALGATLKQLGLKTAFDEPRGSANFGRMAPRRPDDYLTIGEVFHKTFIAVDEEGTEAAAATAVMMMAAGAAAPQREEPPPVVRVDHPFLFAIQDATSGACLFLGVVDDPR